MGNGKVGIHPIQPDRYRAPEVILGCGWDFSTDIWNFGVLAWDIIESTGLFRQVHDVQGRYDTKAHLAEMIALLDPPPRELLAKSDAMTQQNWPNPVENEAGKVCRNARDYFGKFTHDDLIPARKLEATIPSLNEKDRQNFLSFVDDMLTWLPEERKTARELMEHPFFK